MIALVLILGALLWWFGRQMMAPDPVYQGKALSVWLQTYAPSSPYNRPSPEWDEADEAVRQIGTNGIPLLVQMLRERDSSLNGWLLGFAQKHGLTKRLHLVPASERNVEASRAFVALGELGRDAVPELVHAYRANRSVEGRSAIADALAWIGPAARPAIPLLLEAVTNANAKVRASALWALGEIQGEPQQCVPTLASALADTDDWARLSAAHALGRFGTNAQPAVPLLLGLSSSSNAFRGLLSARVQVLFEARKALEQIDPSAFAHLTETSSVMGSYITNYGFRLNPSGP